MGESGDQFAVGEDGGQIIDLHVMMGREGKGGEKGAAPFQKCNSKLQKQVRKNEKGKDTTQEPKKKRKNLQKRSNQDSHLWKITD